MVRPERRTSRGAPHTRAFVSLEMRTRRGNPIRLSNVLHSAYLSTDRNEHQKDKWFLLVCPSHGYLTSATSDRSRLALAFVKAVMHKILLGGALRLTTASERIILYTGEHSLSSHRRARRSLRSKGPTFSSVSA